jgi:hypothetical protein
MAANVQMMAIFWVFTPHSKISCDVSGWVLNTCKGRKGVNYVGMFEGIWPNTVLCPVSPSVAVSLPCLLYIMPSVYAFMEPNSMEQGPQK